MASTSEVYGDPLITPQNEEYWGNVNPNGERSMYDEAKRFAEAATATYARSYDIKTKIIRIFNTYGPNMQLNDGRVVTNLIGDLLLLILSVVTTRKSSTGTVNINKTGLKGEINILSSSGNQS